MTAVIYFEDVAVGDTEAYGSYQVTREEVIDFAAQYDPQPFHLDDEAAAQTYFGRLSASGWHTCAMTMRMMVDHMTEVRRASLGSPGIDKLRWKRPVYPGDTLRVEAEVLEKNRSETRAEMGFVKSRMRVFNQNDELVLEMIANGIMRTRDTSPPS